MKSLLQLWQAVAQDLGGKCSVSTARDYETVTRRVEDEGLSFLTIALPSFGKDLDEALSTGGISPTHFQGFRKRAGTPLFLGGFLEKIFNTVDGSLLDAPCIKSIFAVRQLAGLLGKVELDCTPRRVRAAYEKYIEAEKQLVEAESRMDHPLLDEFSRVSRLLFARVFTQVDGEVSSFDLIPNHSSGSTANGLLGNEKYLCLDWTERMERVFPSSEYTLPNVRFYQRLDRDQLLEPGSEQPVKVIHVPKTLKTPRIIAMEPSYMMYMQQALWRRLKDLLQSDPISGSFIGFTEQGPNQALARIGSADQSLATLDLSEASDRVSNLLVKTMCQNHPHFNEAVQATRSTHADVPGYGKIPLTKFASMGSALCFPFEAMVFTTIIFLGIQKAQKTRLTASAIKAFSGQVRVYGDDLIVPTEYAAEVAAELELYGLVVNRRKSFWTGKFRESCGSDWYAGVNVRPVFCRSVLPRTLRDTHEVESTVSLRNQLYELGCDEAVRYLDGIVKPILRGHYPFVAKTSSVLGRWTSGDLTVTSVHGHTQSPKVKGWVSVPRKRYSPLDDIGALLKYFLSASDLPVTDKEHLVYSGRPAVVTLKLRNRPVH